MASIWGQRPVSAIFRAEVLGAPKREQVLAAWGFTIEDRRLLLHMMAGSKEDAETLTVFFEDMKGARPE
jgi:hypothetical protein